MCWFSNQNEKTNERVMPEIQVSSGWKSFKDIMAILEELEEKYTKEIEEKDKHIQRLEEQNEKLQQALSELKRNSREVFYY